MIEITLQFKTAEEAIVALAKMSGGAAAKAAGQVDAKVSSGALLPAVAQPGPAAPKGRKPRADAGQPRGPNARTQNVGAAGQPESPEVKLAPASPSASSDAAPAAPAPEPAAPAPAQEATAGSAPATAGPVEIPKIEEAEAALTKLFETKGLKIAQETLGAFGVKRLKELLPEDRAKFIAAAKAAL